MSKTTNTWARTGLIVLRAARDVSYSNIAWESRFLAWVAMHLCRLNEMHTSSGSRPIGVEEVQKADLLKTRANEVLRMWSLLGRSVVYDEDECVAWGDLRIAIERLRYCTTGRPQPKTLRYTILSKQLGGLTIEQVWNSVS